MTRLKSTSRGFTIIELLTVIAIVGIMSAIGIASFTNTIASIRMSGKISELVGGLNFARSEATKRGVKVDLCNYSGTTCQTNTNWSSGWQVLVDGTTTQLRLGASTSGGDTLVSSTSTYPIFMPSGYLSYTGTISLHDKNSTPSLYRCLVFSSGSWVSKKGAVCP